MAMGTLGEVRDLNKSAYHLLKRAGQFAADLYSQEVGDRGLTHRQFAVLLTVAQNEGLSQTRLVETTGIDRSTLADLVARLLKKGLLQRKRTREDARANAIRLSAAGRRALLATQPGAATADRRLLNLLPSGQRNEFIAALSVISEALEKMSAESARLNGDDGRAPRRR